MNKSAIHLLFVNSAIDLFKNKPDVPDFIKNEPTFNKIDKIKKIFPHIGLNNFSIDVSDKLTKDINGEIPKFTNELIDEIMHSIVEVIIESVNFKSKSNLYLLLNNTVSKINYDSIKFIDGKYKLLLTDNVEFNNKIFFRKDEPIFRVYGKLNEMLKKELNISMPELSNLDKFKEFSKKNIGFENKKYEVVFSSEGDQGAWDICTMSERGISSCQSWDDRDHLLNRALLGSILSKYIGIIYLTSGKEIKDRGSKMLKRCIVNFVVDGENKKPYIVINKMYDSLDVSILNIFKDVLKSKTKFPVIYYTDINFKDATIPMEEIKLPTKPYDDFTVERKNNKEKKVNLRKLTYKNFINLLNIDDIGDSLFTYLQDNFNNHFSNKFSSSENDRFVFNSIKSEINYLFSDYVKLISNRLINSNILEQKFESILYDLEKEKNIKLKLKLAMNKIMIPSFTKLISISNKIDSNSYSYLFSEIKREVDNVGFSGDDVVFYIKNQLTDPANVDFYLSRLKININEYLNHLNLYIGSFDDE